MKDLDSFAAKEIFAGIFPCQTFCLKRVFTSSRSTSLVGLSSGFASVVDCMKEKARQGGYRRNLSIRIREEGETACIGDSQEKRWTAVIPLGRTSVFK